MTKLKRKTKRTMKTERTNVEFPLWRKKVDNSIFRDKGTTVPMWACKMWLFNKVFPGIVKKSNPNSAVAITFNKKHFEGNVVSTHPKPRKNKVYRFYFSEELLSELKEVFLMSFMRDIESRLREDASNIETDIAFWEFLDIEFDASSKTFHLNAHYTHQPQFPELFKRLTYSPVLKRVDDELGAKEKFRIYKQDWRPRADYEAEIGAENVIYMLIDTHERLLYIGEAEQLIRRFNAGHPSILSWDFYRYDQLPAMSKRQRVALERMMIRAFASVLENKKGISTQGISDYRLANDKIDI
jgi:hypothetical protein